MDKVVVKITIREFSPRLRYVAVLRVRSLTSLIFKKLFDFSLFSTTIRPIGLARIANTIRRDF